MGWSWSVITFSLSWQKLFCPNADFSLSSPSSSPSPWIIPKKKRRYHLLPSHNLPIFAPPRRKGKRKKKEEDCTAAFRLLFLSVSFPHFFYIKTHESTVFTGFERNWKEGRRATVVRYPLASSSLLSFLSFFSSFLLKKKNWKSCVYGDWEGWKEKREEEDCTCHRNPLRGQQDYEVFPYSFCGENSGECCVYGRLGRLGEGKEEDPGYEASRSYNWLFYSVFSKN